MQIKVKCPAKINLILEVLNKREDGFHEIQSIMQAVSLYDYLTIEVENSCVLLTEKEFGGFDDIKELRKTAINYYKKNIQGKTIIHPEIGEIKFTNKGLKKTRNDSADVRKLQSIPKLIEIIKNSNYEGYGQDYKKDVRKSNIDKFHYLIGKTNINNKTFEYRITIFEDMNGYKYYDLADKEISPPNLTNLQKLGNDELTNIITDENIILNPDENIIELSGNSTQIPYDKSNLVYKAAELFLKKANLTGKKIAIYIEKNIPVAAGLAGGSSDAAGTLTGLNKLFNNILNESEINNLAAQLGSDVNFCLKGGTQIATSRGEILNKISTPNLNIVIIKPKNLFISAKEAYTKWDKLFNSGCHCEVLTHVVKSLIMNRLLIRKRMLPKQSKNKEKENGLHNITPDDINALKNNLEDAIINDYPEIQEIKDYLVKKGCKNALMSGSGPSVFGICEEKIDFTDTKPDWECFNVKTINFGVIQTKLTH